MREDQTQTETISLIVLVLSNAMRMKSLSNDSNQSTVGNLRNFIANLGMVLD